MSNAGPFLWRCKTNLGLYQCKMCMTVTWLLMQNMPSGFYDMSWPSCEGCERWTVHPSLQPAQFGSINLTFMVNISCSLYKYQTLCYNLRLGSSNEVITPKNKPASYYRKLRNGNSHPWYCVTVWLPLALLPRTAANTGSVCFRKRNPK